MEAAWKVREEDRGPDGRIVVNPFEAEIARAMADVGGAAGDAPQTEKNTPARLPFGRLELAGIVGGLVLAVALIALLNTFAPERAPRIAPTSEMAATSAPTMTIAPTIATQDAYAAPGGALLGDVPLSSTLAYQHSAWPRWAGVAWDGGIVWVETDAQLKELPDLAPPPTPRPARPQRPVDAPQAERAAPAAPCTLDNAPFVASREVLIGGVPLEQVRAASCNSQAEAEAKASALHDRVLAEATAAAAPPPTPNAR